MTMIPPEEAATDLADPTRRVEGGEIALTRDGKPVLDLVRHRRKGGLDLEAGEAYLRVAGMVRRAGFISDDLDDPLPEDVLIRPRPVRAG
ncbi:prevent-host-death protein [Methylobacterium oxalidis]|uniref:prevent-host-death protein n=1 Tax=Methylobacterium oxalidis TaxID=944322 RepID=UPI0033164139